MKTTDTKEMAMTTSTLTADQIIRRACLSLRSGSILGACEVRGADGSYLVVIRHRGGGGTDYYRYEGGWQPVAWDTLSKRRDYRRVIQARSAEILRGAAVA